MGAGSRTGLVGHVKLQMPFEVPMYKWGEPGSGGHAGVTRSHGSCVLTMGDGAEEGGLGLGRAGRGQQGLLAAAPNLALPVVMQQTHRGRILLRGCGKRRRNGAGG